MALTTVRAKDALDRAMGAPLEKSVQTKIGAAAALTDYDLRIVAHAVADQETAILLSAGLASPAALATTDARYPKTLAAVAMWCGSWDDARTILSQIGS